VKLFLLKGDEVRDLIQPSAYRPESTALKAGRAGAIRAGKKGYPSVRIGFYLASLA